MARVDHEAVVASLKAYIVGADKPGFGARELLEQIGRLEAQHAVEEDRYSQFLDRFGRELEDAFRGVLPPRGGPSDEAAAPLPSTGLPAAKKGQLARPSRGSTSPEGGPPHEHHRTGRSRAGHSPARV